MIDFLIQLYNLCKRRFTQLKTSIRTVDESSTKLLVKCPLEEQNEFLNSVQSVQKMPVDIEILEKLELNKRYYLKT